MSARPSAVWRNLSVPQRQALRHLCDRGGATVGSYGCDLSFWVARSLIRKGLAEFADGHGGSLLQVTATGRRVGG